MADQAFVKSFRLRHRWSDENGLAWAEHQRPDGTVEYSVTTTDDDWGYGASVSEALRALDQSVPPPAGGYPWMCEVCERDVPWLVTVAGTVNGRLCPNCIENAPAGERLTLMSRLEATGLDWVKHIQHAIIDGVDLTLGGRQHCAICERGSANLIPVDLGDVGSVAICFHCYCARPDYARRSGPAFRTGWTGPSRRWWPEPCTKLGQCLGNAGEHGHSHLVTGSDNGRYVMRYDQYGCLIRDERPIQLKCQLSPGRCAGLDAEGDHCHVVRASDYLLAGAWSDYLVVLDEQGAIIADQRPLHVRREWQ